MFNTLDLLKAQVKKYFKKVPRGVDKKTGKIKYRYYYKEHHGGGVTAVEDIKAGAAFKLKDPSTGKAGHFHVKAVDGDKVTVKHDGTDKEVTMTKAEFQALLAREHGQALKETAKKRRESYEKMKRENPKHIGLKAAKNRVEKLERMAGVEKKKPELKEDPRKKIKRLKTFIEYANKVQHFILDNKAMDHKGAQRALDLISEKYLSDDFQNIFTIDQVLAMRPPAQKIDLGKIIKDTEKELIITENELKAEAAQQEQSADNFETMPESKELSKKEKALASQIEASAKKNLDYLQRIIKTDRRESNEYRSKKALQAAVENIFDEVANPLGLDTDYLYFANNKPFFLHIDKSENEDFFNNIYAIYNGDTNAENENLEAYHKIIEKLVIHANIRTSGGGTTAEERRNFKKLKKRFKDQEDLISKKLLKPQEQSADNFETMPEPKPEPAQEPKIPSKAQLTELLSSLDDLLKAKPELKNDPRIVGLLGTENKPTVDTDKRNSKIMLTLDGKNQKENVTYRIVEAGDAIASHEPVGFSKREEYPEGVQERKYHSDKAEMMKVIRNAQSFDPVYLINTNPDATNGPPIITPDGIVLGGNSRVMSAQRVYANHPESAAAYKEYLTKQADTFGFSAEEVSKFKAPLLVREYKPKTETKDHLAKLVRTLNESKTQGIDERQLGLATAVKIRDGRTLGALKIALKESGFDNVENLMTKPSPALNRFKEALFADGVLTNENMNEMIRTHDGTLNGRGRDFIKSMLVGYVVRDSDLLEGLSIGTINHLSTAISKLASAGINEHTRLAMQDAIEIYHHAVGRDKLKRGQTPQQRDAHMNDIMLSEQELFNTKPKENETMEERRQREQGARFAKAKERVSADPLSSSFLKLLTLSVGTKKLGQQMDKMLKLTEDTGVFDMFAGNTKISFGEAARKLSKELSDEFDIEDKLYQLKKALDLLTLLKAIR